MASAEMEIKSPSVPLFQRGKLDCESDHSLNITEAIPLFEKEGQGEICVRNANGNHLIFLSREHERVFNTVI